MLEVSLKFEVYIDQPLAQIVKEKLTEDDVPECKKAVFHYKNTPM